MTKLTYRVNGEEYLTYNEAIKASKGGRYHITRVYTPIIEDIKVDPKKRAKRVAAIREKAKEGK